ncbi:SDR family NAD(P)-dependent oxidoreductase [Nocardia alni]|uniref:SDR family NAD(P)-dependent oxidoreductase n=1 Tax=Nocardia alni TaxID=2815723 RepID=UPI001C23C9E9|nr:SDR family NAD(P)-dependent oxidoreductase [Nocardia alni]
MDDDNVVARVEGSVGDEAPLRGRVAWVSGGASGIGAATVARLAALGASVGVLDLASPAAALGADAHRVCDVGSAESVTRATRELTEVLGPPDIAVTCAGISASAPLHDYPLELWQQLISVDLTGTFLVATAAYRAMVAAGGGRLVLVTSDSAVRPLPGQGGYSAAKAGVIALAKTFAVEGGPRGITSNAVSPGVVDTPLTRNRWRSVEELAAAVEASPARNLMSAVLDPGEVAAAIAFLVHPDSRHITGQTLHVNAGGVLA